MAFQTEFSNLQSQQHLRAMLLQQRWQDLKEREFSARQHNRLLLQQFDQAQDTLSEMLAHNAAMRTIRMEYERYLEENASHRKQQLEGKTRAAQSKRLENSGEEQKKKSPADERLLSQGLTRKPQKEFNNPPSCLQPPSNPPHPHHLTSTLVPHHLWTSPQSNHPLPWSTSGIPSTFQALWGHLNMDEPTQEREMEAETRTAPNLRRERRGESRSSCLSQELDINPVRLSSGHAESSESGRDSSQARREKRKKKTRRASSDREGCSSQESSRTSSVIVTVGVCSNKGTRRRGELFVGAPGMEKEENDSTQSEGDESRSQKEESHSTGEESGRQIEESRSEGAERESPDDKSESCREECSDGVGNKTKNGVAQKEHLESSSSSAELSSADENDVEEEEQENKLGGGHGVEKETSQRDEEQDKVHVEEDEVSVRKSTTEEEEEIGADEELEAQEEDIGRLKTEDDQSRKQGSAFPQDEEVSEDESESDENMIEEEPESDEEAQRGDEAGEEESDSDDSIISPQENRPKNVHVVAEEIDEDDDVDEKRGSKPESSEEDSNEFSEDDIENLLAPQEEPRKREEGSKVDTEPKASCDYVKIFQMERDSPTRTVHQSDSDEFDHFYD